MATRAPSLPRNFAWSLVGNAGYIGGQWAILAVLAKLGPADVASQNLGVYALGLAIVAPMFMLGNLQLRTVLASDAAGESRPVDYALLRLAATLAVVLAAAAIASTHAPATAAAIALIALARACEGLSDLAHGLFTRAEQLRRVASSQLLSGAGGVAGVTLGVVLGGSLVAGCVGLALARALVLVAHDLPLSRGPAAAMRAEIVTRGVDRPPRARARRVLELARRAAPLGLVAGLVSLNTNLPRYLIEATDGPETLGVFVAVGYVALAMVPFVTALAATTVPRISRLWAGRDRGGLRRLAARLVALALAPGLAALPLAATVGGPLLALLSRPESAQHVDLLLMFVGVGILSCLAGILRAVATACQAFVIQVPTTLAAVAVTAGVGLWTIPDDPLYGAAWTVLASRAFIAASNAWVVLRVLR